MRDEHGQAWRGFRAAAVTDRTIDELIGLCRGILADGDVSQGEAAYLLAWLDHNRQIAQDWPARPLYDRIASALADGHMDADEERDIVSILLEITGNDAATGIGDGSMGLAITEPEPTVVFPGRTFCLTGRFLTGPRAHIEHLCRFHGGTVAGNVTHATDYLVVGALKSRDWAHAAFGRKIERAHQLREQGASIAVISERCWHMAAGTTDQRR
jgi:NAD-dependent DNA ligase